MVAIHGEHDHGDGEVCPGCQFKAELAEHLAWAADDGDESWHDLTGEMVVCMASALGMLTALRMAAVDGHDAPPNTAFSAATAIARLGSVIHETWHMLMDDDHADDPGAGL